MSKTKHAATTKPFSEQYKDPRWQKKRLEILQRDDFQCQGCGDKESQLHVHHKMYKYGRDVWDYSDNFFITYCESCHELAHVSLDELKDVLHDCQLASDLFTQDYITDIIGKIMFMNPYDLLSVIKYCEDIKCTAF